MQLQIECNNFPLKQQPCWICSQSFEMKEAQIIICNAQGKRYGEVCPKCINKGFDWLSDRFDQLNKPKKTVVLMQKQKQKTLIGA